MMNCDFFGFDHMRYFKREGNEVPVPFTMKHMSRVAFMCRNPVMTSLFPILLGPAFYGRITLQRFLFCSYQITAVLIGTKLEEMELRKALGDFYEGYAKVLPNSIVPRVSALFWSEKELNH